MQHRKKLMSRIMILCRYPVMRPKYRIRIQSALPMASFVIKLIPNIRMPILPPNNLAGRVTEVSAIKLIKTKTIPAYRNHRFTFFFLISWILSVPRYANVIPSRIVTHHLLLSISFFTSLTKRYPCWHLRYGNLSDRSP